MELGISAAEARERGRAGLTNSRLKEGPGRDRNGHRARRAMAEKMLGG